MAQTQFFMRFYDCDKRVVQSFADKVVEQFSGIDEATVEPLQQSMNAGGFNPDRSWQISYKLSEETRTRIMADVALAAEYRALAAPPSYGANLFVRQPGMKAFRR